MDSYGLFWTKLFKTLMDSYGLLWTHMDSYGLIWTLVVVSYHLASYIFIILVQKALVGKTHMDSYGLIWTHMDSSL